ncbi:uncharacterized protein RCC_00009 [Ramularia collo-cygni]|uniref:Uncharacterized protein n=1 Tax=Ramularia collo-cygni TaxID=112498 RepID=A0A2D3UVL6_9PEZI|nr:uncharacterized protein RCC_00009 [Ramularia collo-cygni]CZT14034.1 uncharacterized protein RCC_00009 [Ramularia collo-cygni]
MRHLKSSSLQQQQQHLALRTILFIIARQHHQQDPLLLSARWLPAPTVRSIRMSSQRAASKSSDVLLWHGLQMEQIQSPTSSVY